MRLILLLALALLAPVALGPVTPFVSAAHGAETYLLGPQDRLSIRVFEWQTVEGEVREWPALGGSFTVGADGGLSLPLVGTVPAAGRATGEVAQEIGDRLQQRFGLSDRPDASVAVEEHRPFFVEGAVRKPGAFPFVPGLDVLQAFSLAGGLPDRVAYGSRVSRDLINASGTIEMLREERARRMIERARIAAEIADGAIAVPEIASMSPEQVSAIVADEQAILDARETRLTRELAALDDLKTLLDQEIVALREKLVAMERRVELARKERESVEGLSRKGLAVRSRVLSTETSVAEIESRMLDTNTAILRAQQEASKAEQTQIGLRTSRAADLARERQEAEAAIGKLDTKIALQQGLRTEAVTFAASSSEADGAAAEPVYTIVRRTPEGSRTLPAAPDTRLEPGDVLQVRVAATASQ